MAGEGGAYAATTYYSVWGLHYSSIATTATAANTILQTMREEGFTRFLERLQRGVECKFCGTFDIAIRFIHHGSSYLFMLLADGKKDSLQIAFFVK